MCDSIMI